MKIKFISVLIISLVILSACSKAQLDENGCFLDSDSAITHAKKKDKNILLFVTMEGDDADSEALVNGVIRDENFKKEIASEYAVLHLDFSQKTYAASVIPENADDDTVKAANQLSEQLQKNTRFVSLLNVTQTPSIYVLSKEAYVLTAFFYDTAEKNLSSFKTLLEKEAPAVNNMEQLIKLTKKGSSLEKVSAIDNLYENTKPEYRVFLADLLSSVEKIDKENKSGLLGKYIYAAADANALKLINQGNVNEAVSCYLEAAENSFSEPSIKQQCYYIAAYLSAMSGIAEPSVVIDYLQKSIDADPESEEVASIKKVMEVISAGKKE